MKNQDQTIFQIESQGFYKLSDFIVSECNSEAYEVISSWPNSIWGVNPYKNSLLILGPKLSGKTYLTKIWNNRRDLNQVSDPSYLGEKNNKIIFEDIDFLAESEERDLLHIFNSAHEEKKYLLLTATNFPTYHLKDLKSRINSINVVRIHPPDDNILVTMIFKLFSDNSVKINNDTVKYLVKILPRDFVSIRNSVLKINQFALISGRKVTIPFIKEIYYANLNN